MLFTDVSSERVVRVFGKVGFWISATHGRKHIGMTNGNRKITVPRHTRLNPYTLKAIIRDAGLTDDQFAEITLKGMYYQAVFPSCAAKDGSIIPIGQ